jgi:tetratricopeptide (TPR) repeat protein
MSDETTTREIRRRFDEGDLAGAERLCHEALARDPGDPAVLHLLGLWELSRGQSREAVALITRSLERAPHDAVALENLGLAQLVGGDPVAAEAALRRALEAGATNASLHMRLGLALGQQGRHFEAEAALRTAVRLAPDVPDVHMNLGSLLALQGRTDEALECLRRVVEIAPGHADAQFNIGTLLQGAGRFAEAEPAYRAALALAPDYADAHNNLGVVCERTGRSDEAVRCYRAAVAADPRHVHAWSNLGKALRERGDLAGAEQSCRRALDLDPSFADAHVNLASVRADQGRYADSRLEYESALASDPGNFDAQLNYAMLCLAQGDYRTGWAAYRSRPTRRRADTERFALDEALPGELAGRRVLLIGEQGLGEELFFLRYAPVLKALGARVACQCDVRLAGMLRRTGVFETVAVHGESTPAADLRFLLGDVPALLGPLPASPFRSRRAALPDGLRNFVAGLPQLATVHVPQPVPLALAPLPERVTAMRRRLAALGPPPWIGITWRAGLAPEGPFARADGSPPKQIDPLLVARALAGLPGTVLVLQREPRADEIAALGAALPGRAHDLSAVNEDLEDMLALLSLLSEYVGVSNTNMHLLAGAGGRARVLVPHPPEWRWMLEGAASPWFPGFRSYRQAAGGDWSAALASLAADLGRALVRGTPGPGA